MKWEYTSRRSNKMGTHMDMLGAMGESGWELVGFESSSWDGSMYYIFKRPKAETSG